MNKVPSVVIIFVSAVLLDVSLLTVISFLKVNSMVQVDEAEVLSVYFHRRITIIALHVVKGQSNQNRLVC